LAHPVTCYYCGERFDRDKEEAVQVNSRRWAHKKCAQENTVDYRQLIFDLMKSVLKEKYSYFKINQQIAAFQKDAGYTLENIYGTLNYWYNVKKSGTEKANGGIGIVPYVYAEYLGWKERQEAIKQSNVGKKISDFVGQQPRVIEGKAIPIKKPRHVRFYELQ